MNFLSLIGMELKKLRRSKMILIFVLAAVILWLPSIINAHLNFEMQAEGISPENNFFIQGFMGFAWFMFPAGMVVVTVLLIQTEKAGNGILKMLALPVNTMKLCFAKFVVLLLLSAFQMLVTIGMYYVSVGIASYTQHYHFYLPPPFVWREGVCMWLSAVPMLSFFWMLAVCIRTPIFSIGAGLASIVPSVLIINTKVWFAYPMAYPLFVIVSEYGKLASNLETAQIEIFPWLPAAFGITIVCLLISCICFGKAERR